MGSGSEFNNSAIVTKDIDVYVLYKKYTCYICTYLANSIGGNYSGSSNYVYYGDTVSLPTVTSFTSSGKTYVGDGWCSIPDDGYAGGDILTQSNYTSKNGVWFTSTTKIDDTNTDTSGNISICALYKQSP